MANNAVQQILKQKIFSRVDLDASTSFRFFNESDTPSKFGNIDSPSKIDENSLFEVDRINFFAMASDGAPLVTATLALVAQFIESTFGTIKQNTVNEIISFASASVMVAPLAVAPAGASAYNPAAVLSGSIEMDIKWKIYGGQNINVTIANPEANDFTGISILIELEGVIDRSQSVERV